MANTIQLLRSTTSGNTPASLVTGQIAINEADGRLFYRSSPSGAVTQFTAPQVLEYATPANFPAAGTSARLYCATDTGRLYRWSGAVYYEIGGRPRLSPINSFVFG